MLPALKQLETADYLPSSQLNQLLNYLPLLLPPPCEASPPFLLTLSLVLLLAASNPLSLCGALPPFLLTRSLVLRLAAAKPLLDAVLEALPLLEELDLLRALVFDAALDAVLDADFEEDLDAPLDEVFEAALEDVLLEDLEAGRDEREEDFDDAVELLECPLEDLLLPPDLLLLFLGTFSPASLASDKPMAMACLREVTFFPLRPLFNSPCFFSCIALSTFLPAPFEYLAILFDLKGLPVMC